MKLDPQLERSQRVVGSLETEPSRLTLNVEYQTKRSRRATLMIVVRTPGALLATDSRMTAG